MKKFKQLIIFSPVARRVQKFVNTNKHVYHSCVRHSDINFPIIGRFDSMMHMQNERPLVLNLSTQIESYRRGNAEVIRDIHTIAHVHGRVNALLITPYRHIAKTFARRNPMLICKHVSKIEHVYGFTYETVLLLNEWFKVDPVILETINNIERLKSPDGIRL